MFNFILLDLPRRFQMTFQDTATPVMSAILDLHSYISFFLILILIFVAFQLFDVLNFFRVDRDYTIQANKPAFVFFFIDRINYLILHKVREREFIKTMGGLLPKKKKNNLLGVLVMFSGSNLLSFFLEYVSSKLSFFFFVISFKSKIHKFLHQTNLETLWTLFPVVVILCIAIPSFMLLYAIDVMVDSSIVIKAIGKQWYWNYELEFPFLSLNNSQMKFKRRIFDSYMLNLGDLVRGQLRGLEVDQALLLPLKTHVDLVITADDVLHSFSLPSLGVKVDAVPGRLNHMGIFVERPGVFYGQCSELCGTNHAFMPIKALCLPYDKYVFANEKGTFVS